MGLIRDISCGRLSEFFVLLYLLTIKHSGVLSMGFRSLLIVQKSTLGLVEPVGTRD